MPEIDVDFYDERNRLSHWYPTVEDLDAVKTVPTEIVELQEEVEPFFYRDRTPESMMEMLDELPLDEIDDALHRIGSERVNLRSDYKSTTGFSNGSPSSEKELLQEVLEVINNMEMKGFPMDKLVIRDYIEQPVVAESYTPIHPEVRFIVDEGEVLGWFIDVHADDFNIDYEVEWIDDDEEDEWDSEMATLIADVDEESNDTNTDKKSAQAVMDELNAMVEPDIDHLRSMAKAVAQELDDTGWSVDFIRDVDGNWYLSDMALYALYWNERHQQWQNLSAIKTGLEYNLEENLPENLPEKPE